VLERRPGAAEAPPEGDDWEDRMCAVLAEGRRAGRRHSTVILAEGAVDRHGRPIEAEHVGTSRKVPSAEELGTLAGLLARRQVEGILLVGGWAAYQAAFGMQAAPAAHAAFRIPIVCVPAGIDNSLPGSELSIGADTALNATVEAVDEIKRSAVAWRRAFVVEVMGRFWGYLAVMSGLATGAERVWTHEEGITMAALEKDVEGLAEGFRKGKRLALMIRNEIASPVFTTDVLRRLLEEEGRGQFDSRQAILGHLQQGGDPTPFDRIVAIRSSARASGPPPLARMPFEARRGCSPARAPRRLFRSDLRRRESRSCWNPARGRRRRAFGR
jgi:6-phosphofructokinase